MIQELSQAKRDPQRFTRAAANPDGTWLTEALAIALAPPRWQPDPALIERGQRVFADYGLYQASALFFASLPMAYATLDGAAVLARVSDLATQNLVRRVAETGQMLLDVMGLRGGHSLDPGAPGYMTAVGLRLMHACVRVLVASSRPLIRGQRRSSARQRTRNLCSARCLISPRWRGRRWRGWASR